MRSLTLGSLMVGLVGGALLIGCGDDTTSTGGSGTGGQATGAGNVGGNPTTGGNTSTGGGGAGPGACVDITVPDFGWLGSDPFSGIVGAYGGAPMPSLGGALEDSLAALFYDPAITGTVDLSTQADPMACTTCIYISEDVDADGNTTKLYFQESGTVDIGASTPDQIYITGSITNAKFIEIDPMTGAPVAGGSCLTLASQNFTITPPTPGWTCDPNYYNAMDGCDCACGAVDPDCSDAMAMVYGCQEGQTCDANGECAGLPTGWTCAPDQFDGGAGNGCDCNCGAADPDCDLMGEMVDGCQAGEVCQNGGCFNDTLWTCDSAYFGDSSCDCGCGFVDVDCADATKASCDFCNDMGSCDTVACDDPASTINATNNAVCGM